MSIASEISRLSSNISDSLDAVAAKGVTVPSDSNSDDLPGLIALIEQGSGGDSGGTIYQDTDGYLHLSEDNKNVISIVDTLDTAGGTIRTITSKVDSGGCSDALKWIAAASPAPSIRNMFNALATGAYEHGEFTLASTPTTTQIDLFRLSSISAPAQGIIFVDKAFYQGADASTLPNNGDSEAISFIWYDKAFLNPAKETSLNSEYPCYAAMSWSVSQTSTTSTAGGGSGCAIFDNSTVSFRGYYQWDNSTFKWRSQFGGLQYTTFVAGRTYIWMAY